VKKPAQRVIGIDLINPVDKTRDLARTTSPRSLPARQVPLSLTLEGTGVVECLLPSLYRRPW
jgi:hypothetical protein